MRVKKIILWAYLLGFIWLAVVAVKLQITYRQPFDPVKWNDRSEHQGSRNRLNEGIKLHRQLLLIDKTKAEILAMLGDPHQSDYDIKRNRFIYALQLQSWDYCVLRIFFEGDVAEAVMVTSS